MRKFKKKRRKKKLINPDLAGIRFVSRVNHHMSLEVSLLGKVTMTNWTQECFIVSR